MAITKAKKECFKYQRPPWSEVLHKASLTLRYWIIAESSLLNKIKTNEVLNNIQNTIPELDKNIQQLSHLKKKKTLPNKSIQTGSSQATTISKEKCSRT